MTGRRPSTALSERIPTVLRTGVIGILAGTLSGFLGVGGGIVMVPALVLFVHLSQHGAHATSLAAIAPIAAVALVPFVLHGETSVAAAALLLPTSMVGAIVGARTMHRLDDELLRRVFGLVLIVVAGSLLL